jgi:two-component system, NtrC family, response regulator AtoC
MSNATGSIDDPAAGTADPWGATRTQDGPAPASPESARCYLMVFESSSATMVPLPPSGEFLIGRGHEADLRIRAAAASRLHVKLIAKDGAVQIADLSRHGTRVNGAPLGGATWLSSGDVVSICDTSLVFHRDAGAPRVTPLGDLGQLRPRLAEEVERSRRYRRPLLVVCASTGGDALSGPALTAALRDLTLPFIAAAAFAGDSHLLLLLPEAGDSASAAARLLAQLRPSAPALRLGFASCPEDGCDPDALVAGARAAADGAAEGQAVPAAQMATRLVVGGRTIVIAEPVMAGVYDLLRKLARSDLAVLITGETGSGKEIAATALHN